MAELTTRQKAAAVIMSLDADAAAAVLKNLPEDDLAVVTREMHALGDLEPQAAASILYEFQMRASAEPGISVSPEILRERLELAVGRDSARHLLQEIGVDHSAEDLFRPLESLSAEELNKILMDEHPQTISLVLANLDPKLTAGVLALCPAALQTDCIRRMARCQQADESLLKRVSDMIRSKISMLGEVRKTPDDPRYKKVAEVINLLGAQAEDEILKQLNTEAPEMVKKLREMMFVFEDLVNLSDADTRKLLQSVDGQILAMALKTASEEVKAKLFANLSKRATETLTEELELLGPKPLSQVKAAQQQLVESIRKMNAAGEINIRGSKYDEDPMV